MNQGARQSWSRDPSVSFRICADIPTYQAYRTAAHLARGEIPLLSRKAQFGPFYSSIEVVTFRDNIVWAQKNVPEAAIASYLAWATGCGCLLVDNLEDLPADTSGLIVADGNKLSDSVLSRLLANIAFELTDGRDWEQIPRLGLVTGRDIHAVSWMAAKIVAANRRQKQQQQKVRLAFISPGEEAAELLIDDRDLSVFRGRVTDMPRTNVADVLAVRTHGSEACAKGSNGIVYCGKRAGPSDTPAENEGVLACGRGHDCPRGPSPTPVAPLAEVLMMSVCNGFRLAGSINHADFNFGLSFVDGEGLAYVSSMTSSSGAGPAAVAFLATVADGGTIADATLAANAVPLLAGIDDASFVAIGNPCYRPAGSRRPMRTYQCEHLPATIDAREDHCLALHVNNDTLATLARQGKLAIDVQSEDRSVTPVGFARASGSEKTNSPIAEIRLYSFPEPLGCVRIVAHDTSTLALNGRHLLASFDKWISLWRSLGLDKERPDFFIEIADAREAIFTGLAQKIPLMRLAGHCAVTAAKQIEACQGFLNGVACETIEALAPRLTGSFWLTNEMAAQHCFGGSEEIDCPSCGQPARARRISHALTGVERTVLVCGRCGIGLDADTSGAIASVKLDFEKPVCAGEELVISVEVMANRSATGIFAVRLTMPGQAIQNPLPMYGEIRLSKDEATRFTVRCTLDQKTAPHRYYIKALLATSDELVFACRSFFVTPGDA